MDDIKECIERAYQDLTKTEKKLADFILAAESNRQTGPDLSLFTLADYASEVGVGQASILRFVKKIGFENFAVFRLRVWREWSERGQTPPVKEGDIKAYIRNCVPEKYRETYQQAARMIQQKETIYFFGVGTSRYTAELGAHAFFRTGKYTQTLQDIHDVNMHIALSKEKEIFVFISRSGTTTEITAALQAAKRQNCQTILITQNTDPAIATEAGLTLIVSSTAIGAGVTSLVGTIIQMCAIEVLFEAFINLDRSAVLKNQEKTMQSIIDYHPAYWDQ